MRLGGGLLDLCNLASCVQCTVLNRTAAQQENHISSILELVQSTKQFFP
jgi:hypothetical protein